MRERGVRAWMREPLVHFLALGALLFALHAWAWRVPAYSIGTIAAFWTVQRVASFW